MVDETESKLNTVNTYSDTSNYWAPLADNEQETAENEVEAETNITLSQPPICSGEIYCFSMTFL